LSEVPFPGKPTDKQYFLRNLLVVSHEKGFGKVEDERGPRYESDLQRRREKGGRGDRLKLKTKFPHSPENGSVIPQEVLNKNEKGGTQSKQ